MLFFYTRSPTDIQRSYRAQSSLKKFGKDPAWIPIVTFNQSAILTNVLTQGCRLVKYHVECPFTDSGIISTMQMTNMDNDHIPKYSVNGEPVLDNFYCEECLYPELHQDGEVIIKTLYLSVDPALRCRMNESTGVDYIGPWEVGKPVSGFGGVGKVVESRNASYTPGDLVETATGWPWKSYYSVVLDEGSDLRKMDTALLGGRITLPLTVLGLIGLTSYLGVMEKGHINQDGNQTMVVSGAAGACGSLAGQIGRLLGCSRVVGICGSEEKCQFLTRDLSFDAAINYKKGDITEELKKSCPNGVDIYFDNVGGDISDTVISQMNPNSHVILCGQIAVYNKDVPYPPPIPTHTETILQKNNITRERFLVLNYQEKFTEAMQQLAQWVLQGQLKYRETIAEGIEKAGEAFVSMMRGGNIGKQLVHVADP
ncbi:hypothetical protein FSP39_000359 [Pinctada imbricata]|uniref:15-oxoprostaglandin 13-reductase n=1 Tax=Pinctada imbricata TaxID=66713 RepID=A0AA88Y488_PINIB|nr:hypothetical protein FSP39_000359 [Pinctada imbricata]